MRLRHVLVLVVAVGGAERVTAQLVVGGDLLDNCDDVSSLVDTGAFSEARDKARLCLDGIEQELTGAVGSLFPSQVGDWSRTDFEESNVAGFSNITSTYEKGDLQVDVLLTGAAGGGRGGSGLGGLGGLFGGIAQNALLQSGQQVSVAGLPAAVQPDGSLIVPLEDGSMLMFESNDFDDADAALAGMGDLIDGFPVAEINAALQ